MARLVRLEGSELRSYPPAHLRWVSVHLTSLMHDLMQAIVQRYSANGGRMSRRNTARVGAHKSHKSSHVSFGGAETEGGVFFLPCGVNADESRSCLPSPH